MLTGIICTVNVLAFVQTCMCVVLAKVQLRNLNNDSFFDRKKTACVICERKSVLTDFYCIIYIPFVIFDDCYTSFQSDDIPTALFWFVFDAGTKYLLLISYKFVKGFLAITFLLLNVFVELKLS